MRMTRMIATHLPAPPPPAFCGAGAVFVAGAGRAVAGDGLDVGVECWRAAGVDTLPGAGAGAGRAAGAIGTGRGAGAGAGAFAAGFGPGAGAGPAVRPAPGGAGPPRGGLPQAALSRSLILLQRPLGAFITPPPLHP